MSRWIAPGCALLLLACGARTPLEPLEEKGGPPPAPSDASVPPSIPDGGTTPPPPPPPPPDGGGGGFPPGPGPSPVHGLRKVSTGWRHSCAIARGRVWCWGFNRTGQLGDGSHTDHPAPVRVVDIDDAVEVSAGLQHTCARLATGRVRCWGSNLVGQLGDGSGAPRATPVEVRGIEDAVGIAAAGEHSCALLASGELLCWGHNAFGQLGDGTFHSREVPVRVEGLTDLVQVEAGWRHTCAIRRGGQVYCWGTGRLERGMSKPPDAAAPRRLEGLDDAVQVSAGTTRTCVLRAGGSGGCVTALAQRWRGRSFSPLLSSDLRHVSAGDLEQTCVVRGSGRVRCLDGAPMDLRFSDPGVDDAQTVSLGYEHACAALDGGGVACWGSDEFGQLGDGSGTPSEEEAVFVRLP